jgi:hypothetical protein
LLLRRPKKKMLPRKGGFGVDGSRGGRKMVERVSVWQRAREEETVEG